MMFTSNEIHYMAKRFLAWPLPEGFHPDGGISFEPHGNVGTDREYKRFPTGTNLLGYAQALAMVRYMIGDLPEHSTPSKPGDNYEAFLRAVAVENELKPHDTEVVKFADRILARLYIEGFLIKHAATPDENTSLRQYVDAVNLWMAGLDQLARFHEYCLKEGIPLP